MVYSVWKPVLFIFILISLSVSSWGQGVILFNNYIDIEELGNPFQHPEWGLYYLNPFTPNAPPVQFAQGMMSSPVLSPDGSTLVFAAPHIKIQKAIGLYSVPVSGGIPTVISHMIGEAGNPSFSPDGSMVVYEVFLPGSGGGQPTPTPTQGLPLQPGPGNSLLKPQQGDFIFPAANPFIAIARMDGSDAEGVYHKALPHQGIQQAWSRPSWHPTDMNRIAVSIRNANQVMQEHPSIPPLFGAGIYVVSPDASNIRLLFTPMQPDIINGIFAWEEDTAPAWSPDGQRIAYVRQFIELNRPTIYSIYIMRADGSDAPGVPVTPQFNNLADVGGISRSPGHRMDNGSPSVSPPRFSQEFLPDMTSLWSKLTAVISPRSPEMQKATVPSGYPAIPCPRISASHLRINLPQHQSPPDQLLPPHHQPEAVDMISRWTRCLSCRMTAGAVLMTMSRSPIPQWDRVFGL